MGSYRYLSADYIDGIDFQKNYLRSRTGSDVSAEKGVNNFLAYKDAAQSVPEDGLGGAATLISTQINGVNPIEGQSSYRIVKSAGNAQGEGVAINFTLEKSAQGKILQISFDYLVQSGTFTAGTSSSDSDLIVYMYDVTNSRAIQPSSFRLLSNSSTLTDTFVGNFQTTDNGTQYRLIFHVATTNTAAWTLGIDELKVVKSRYTYGTPITDWQSYVPTFQGFGTPTSVDSFYRRVGSDCEIRGRFFSGTSSAVEARIGLPSGLVSLGTSQVNLIGYASRNQAATQQYGLLLEDNVNYVTISVTGTSAGLIKRNGNDVLNTGESLSYFASVPIDGWSSSVRMSDDIMWIDDVGQVAAFAVDSATPPRGYLFCDGAAVSRATYAELFTKIGTLHGAGDGSTTFNLPDYRGMFLRGLGTHGSAVNGVTPSRSGAVGSKQSDAMQGHRHPAPVNSGANTFGSSGVTGLGLNGSGITSQTLPNTGDPTSNGSDGTPRTSNETRPANVGVNYFIKFTRTAAPVAADGVTEKLRDNGDIITVIGNKVDRLPLGASGNALVSNGTNLVYGFPSQLSTASGTAPSFAARAWVNFNGGVGASIRGSGNVSSVTRVNTGEYLINFTTNMQDTNYAAVSGLNKPGNIAVNELASVIDIRDRNTNNFRLFSVVYGGFNSTPSRVDHESIYVAVFR